MLTILTRQEYETPAGPLATRALKRADTVAVQENDGSFTLVASRTVLGAGASRTVEDLNLQQVNDIHGEDVAA